MPLRAFCLIALVAMGSGPVLAEPPPDSGGVSCFLESIVGEWIGTCEQSTDGQPADDKYFRAVVRRTGGSTYEGCIECYGTDAKTQATVSLGKSTFAIAIRPDGCATNRIVGTGSVLVDKKPRNEKHDFVETVSASENGLKGTGVGAISVSGLPFDVGKRGKVRDAKSTWTLNDGLLTICQDLKAGFRVLMFGKAFTISARYTARRGSDIASLTKRGPQASERHDAMAKEGAGL